MQTIAIASDHAGISLKKFLQESITGVKWVDMGPHNGDRVDYPDFADKVAREVTSSQVRGILICGSGQGMAMRANKYPGVRAALCWDTVSAGLARSHNDANILCVGERLLPYGLVLEIVETFLKTSFENGRHAQRVAKISRPVDA